MTEIKNWLKITLKTDPVILESISAGLFELGCEGIEEGTSECRLYFAGSIKSDQLLQAILDLLSPFDPEFSAEKLDMTVIPNQNWNEEWKKGFQPFHVTPHLIIQPDWEDIRPAAGETVITIAPKMAFGTGHHETTRLILRLMGNCLKPGDRVLDLGTGSGILAIYAKKKGAAEVLGVDTDPLAIDNFEENVKLNKLSGGITGRIGDIEAGGMQTFHLIMANINRNVLLEIPVKLKSLATENATLILSGILISDLECIREAYGQAGWKTVQEARENEWVALVMN